MEWSWTTWAVSVAFVLASGWCAWREGNWRRRDDLDIGFVEHGGMWGDLVLLPIANAAIVPWLSFGAWLVPAALVGIAVSWWLHRGWHGGDDDGFWREHLWPSRAHGRWARDLSWAGWLHVIYVAAEMTLLVGYAVTPMPSLVIALVTLVLTLHVPLGLLSPAWVATHGHLVRNHLLWPAVLIAWAVALVKTFGPA